MKPVAASRPPVMPRVLRPQTLAGLADGFELEAAVIAGETHTKLVARAVSLEASSLQAVELSSCLLKASSLIDVGLDDCLLFGSDFDGSGWRRVAISGGMSSGLVLSDTVLEDVSFRQVKLTLANFRVSKLKRVSFIDCDLTEADFQAARLDQVSFRGCQLRGADFSGCQVVAADLRGAQVAALKGVAGLRGAVFAAAQIIALAPHLAAELGLVTEP